MELARLVGQHVDIEVEVTERDPNALARIVEQIDAVAVLADVYRGDLAELRRAVAPVPVLRPLFERRPRYAPGVGIRGSFPGPFFGVRRVFTVFFGRRGCRHGWDGCAQGGT
jgi:hypothetical protein